MCLALAPGRTACSLVQRQVLENGAILMALEISGLEAAAGGGGTVPLLTLTAPLGTRLADGMFLSVDGAELGRLAFGICRQGGCVAQLAGEEMLARLRAGIALEVRFMLEVAPDRVEEVSLSAPLDGISRAVDMIRGAG